MKTALNLSIVIAVAVIMTTLQDTGWFVDTLLTMSAMLALLKACATFGDK